MRGNRKSWHPKQLERDQGTGSLNGEPQILLQSFDNEKHAVNGGFHDDEGRDYQETSLPEEHLILSDESIKYDRGNTNASSLLRQKSLRSSSRKPRSGSLVKYLAEDKDLKGKWGEYLSCRRDARLDASKYRKGPIPVEDLQKSDKAFSPFSTSQLDSDIEDNEISDKQLGNDQSLPGSRGLLIYFARLNQGGEEENVDFLFIDSLLAAGADINFTDRYGQTILHSVARDWHPDVARFVIEKGGRVDAQDRFGRTPLHVAAAFDYPEMVEFLVAFGADIESKTQGEMQTPLHYAARNNAISALKALVKLGANINDRDYKTRTPLFVASELGRIDTAKYLLDIGAPAGVYDKGGNSAVAVMVEKMPSNAREALGQFYMTDRAFRKDYYYLSYLEHEKDRNRTLHKPLAKTPLELICFYKELDLVMHPVIRKLIEVKWNLFGRKYTIVLLLMNLLYASIWTILGFLVPRNGAFYSPLKENAWRITLEILLVIMTIYFIAKQIRDARKVQLKYNEWKDWRIRDIERDFTYCHPKWPEERRFIEGEVHRLKNYKGSYFQNFWNWFEWVSLLAICGVVLTRALYVGYNSGPSSKLLGAHKIVFSISLLLIWLRMMKVYQGFAFLSSFITLLGHVITDTLKFAFLFFEFFIPYCCAFWMMFGGPENAKIFKQAGANDKMFSSMSELIYTVWTMTLVGDFPYEGMVEINEALAQLLTGSYFALVSLVCVNLYIALMSETFSRVYANAQANAAIQQAGLMLSLEGELSTKEKKKNRKYIIKHCGPLEEFSDHQKYVDSEKSDELKRTIVAVGNSVDCLRDRIAEFENELGDRFALQELKQSPVNDMEKRIRQLQRNTEDLKNTMAQTHDKILENQLAILETLKKGGFRLPQIFSAAQEGEETSEGIGMKSLLGNFGRMFGADKGPSDAAGVPATAPDESKSGKALKSEEGLTEDPPTNVTAGQANEETGKRRRRRGRSKSRNAHFSDDVKASDNESTPSFRLQLPRLRNNGKET